MSTSSGRKGGNVSTSSGSGVNATTGGGAREGIGRTRSDGTASTGNGRTDNTIDTRSSTGTNITTASGAGDGYTSQASNKTDYSTQTSNSDYPTSDEHKMIMPDRSLPIGRLGSRTSEPETSINQYIENRPIESRSSSSGMSSESSHKILLPGSGSTSSIKCDSLARPISDGSDVNSSFDQQKYMQQLCYGSSGGDDVTALKEEIKKRDDLVAELSGDVTVLKANTEALERKFAECSKEKEHYQNEVVMITQKLSLKDKGFLREGLLTEDERLSTASHKNEALRSELEALKKKLTQKEVNIQKLKEFISRNVKPSDDKEEEPQLLSATVEAKLRAEMKEKDDKIESYALKLQKFEKTAQNVSLMVQHNSATKDRVEEMEGAYAQLEVINRGRG